MLKVLYDLSLVGYSSQTVLAKTGIFRVVENVALGLSARDDVEVTLCAYDSWQSAALVLDYLRSDARLGSVPFAATALDRRGAAPLARALMRLYGCPANLLTDLSKRVMWRVVQGLNRFYPRIRPRALREYDIFHSSSFPLPARDDRQSELKYFATVYDLIPILRPDWFTQAHIRDFSRIIESIGPDDFAICISSATKNDLCNHLPIRPERVFVTPLAAARDIFYPTTDQERMSAVRKKYGIPDGPYVLSVNTLEPRKNVDHTIRAFAQLLEQEHITDLHFVLVGANGWAYDQIDRAIADAGAATKRIILTGYVADEDLSALYSGAMCFVYPSLYEGFGLPPLEAMQCGVPVITSNTSSLPEVVGDGGIMVGATDQDELCHQILALYRDPERRALWAAKALERARVFSWDRCVRETVAAYSAALSA